MGGLCLLWGCILLLTTWTSSVSARNKSPLMDDEGTRARNKAAECVFGKQVRELGSQWIPDLGVPIGVLYCMKCECVPIQRKRRIVAKVQCRSIKDECPEPTCAEPIHLPGRCCKTCPGDNTVYDGPVDIISQTVIDEEEKNTKHYAALLTGRSSLVLKNDYMKPIPNDLNKNNVVATGRFTFHKKNLYYSFYISDKAARPRSLQFVDNAGNILEEFVLSRAGGLVNSLYQNATRKVCGVWKRLPRDYRKILKQDKMFVVLIWGTKDQAEFTISGQVMKYLALGSELFSSLMEPAPGVNSMAMAGAGGTAIVSVSTAVPTSIHLAIIFNGMFNSDETHNVPLNVTLSLDDKKFILQETVRVRTPQSEINLVEISASVTPADLRLLTRGRLLLSVTSVSKPEALRLSGNVITKATCELFQTTLASSNADYNANPSGTSGLAWLYLNNEGSLVYNVQIDNLKEEMPAVITLVDLSTKRRVELEDLTPYFVNGWANGTVDKLSPKVLEPLYSGNLGVNVATSKDRSLIWGRLIAKPVADARDAPAPFLLKRENYTLPTSAVGLAWIYIDNECHLHYDVSLNGLGGGDKNFELYLELLPMLAPGAPVITRLLDEFQGNQVEGSPINSLNREEVNRLDSGVGFLKVKEKKSKILLLTATIRHVIIPSGCRPSSVDNNVIAIPSDDLEVQVPTSSCFYEGKFYDEEAQWTTAANPCTMCYCENGLNKCFTMKCPPITCPSNMVLTNVPGECCPICVNTSATSLDMRNSSKKCILNGITYSPGSKFHPFLIPIGFDSCTVCTCDSETKCQRVSNEKECCPNCQNSEFAADDAVPVVASLMPKKEIPAKTAEDILNEGGCKNVFNPAKPYVNGSEYHPTIVSLGEYKCVNCKCQNGIQDCKRQPCDKTTCMKMFKLRKQGNEVNSAAFCCSVRDCRKYKHKRNNSHRQSS